MAAQVIACEARREKIPDDAGAVLILFALLLNVIIVLAALAIDLSMYETQHAKYRRVAEQAALASLERYLEELSSSAAAGANVVASPDLALRSARDRARQLIQRELPQLYTTSYLSDRTLPTDDLGVPGQNGANGQVVPGIWHFTTPLDPSRCDEPTTDGPCFETVPNSSKANAIRVEFNVHPESPLRVIFSGLAPESHRPFRITATASLIPRRGVFLLDLSRSITRDTHRGLGEGATPAEFAFQVEDAGCDDPDWKSKLIPHRDADQDVFNRLPDTRVATAAGDAQYHAKDEYVCRTVPVRDEAGSVVESVSFAVDNNTLPQPLTDILSGLHSALDAFRIRSVPSDLVGIVGFDDEVLPQRTLPLVNPSMSEAKFRDFYSATDVDGRTGLADHATFLEQYLFPRYYGGSHAGTIRLPAMTDVQEALREALQMLADAERDGPADKFIVLVTDGLCNCVQHPIDFRGTPMQCFFAQNHELRTYNANFIGRCLEDISRIADTLATNEIKLHVMLSGDYVEPHILLRRGDDGVLDDAGARQNQPYPLEMVDHMTRPAVFPTASGAPFHTPNHLYYQARKTGGKWLPNTDCCRDEDEECLNVEDELAELLETHKVKMGETLCCVEGVHSANCKAYSREVCPWADGSGRLKCDPSGRDSRDRIAEAFSDVMGENPFTLVESFSKTF
ncbi:MAG: VWA domain-containing protein [Bdellovibrionales bacterium]|nr:VWA domain-containing protein [Bdellovibrionales bacterium]